VLSLRRPVRPFQTSPCACDHLQAQAQLAGVAVAHHLGAAGVGAEVAANGATALGGQAQREQKALRFAQASCKVCNTQPASTVTVRLAASMVRIALHAASGSAPPGCRMHPAWSPPPCRCCHLGARWLTRAATQALTHGCATCFGVGRAHHRQRPAAFAFAPVLLPGAAGRPRSAHGRRPRWRAVGLAMGHVMA